jgi:hypothetical protein
MTYIGATGIYTFEDTIDTLSSSIAIDIINTSNYVSKLDGCSSNYVLSTI